MHKYFKNYYWKNGKPYGLEEVTHEAPISYRIVTDPYYKRFSIEKYSLKFDKIIYDSLLLDFRHLTLKDQVAWEREMLKEEENRSISLLRNQDDRAVLIETLTFHNNQCRACMTSSIHGIPLALHKMFYVSLGDSFNGVILYDVEERPVMRKVYEIDSQSGEFTNLLSEEWDMQSFIQI